MHVIVKAEGDTLHEPPSAELLVQAGLDEPTRPRSSSSSSVAVATDNVVAVMRELYASGDADGALALASLIEEEEDDPDPFGGLIPVDEEDGDTSETILAGGVHPKARLSQPR